MSDLTLIVAGDPQQLTGGYLYDARIVEALRSQGWAVTVVGLEGRFPEPDAVASHALDSALTALVDGSRVVIDGLAMGGLPAIVERHASRLSITALLHHPLCDETGLGEPERQRFRISETRGLAAVERVIVTSVYTARRLADFDVPANKIAVIEPGVIRGELAHGDLTQPRLLCVATLTPRKGQDVLVEALAELTHLPWQCDLIGDLDRAPDYAAQVRAAIARHGLEGRIRLLGAQPSAALGEHYRDATLFVLPSHYEGYGMVITEALAHGLPVVTTTGGALAHTLPEQAGIKVPPGDSRALGEALTKLLSDPEQYQRYRDGARALRDTLGDWDSAARAFAAALTRETT
ncbi:glycosyltransferase family 1 protein [Salinicola endophyticus]|uniref:Glycosyltransferase family 1 protein n=1 Tax=Salinicola endophyticus TaxID=1949083 RepID=A0ABY8FB29_9GAMM|nr:glycosyltransferase family 4 protein [Salinicola endophyticus]WFF40023.1 glycosyltransferase family 1 protein [Salinicola endophyticus]